MVLFPAAGDRPALPWLQRFPLLLLIICIRPAMAGEKMRFEWASNGGNCAACSWIRAAGEITMDTPDDFARFVQSEASRGFNLRNQTIELDSSGGTVSAAVDLGEAFRHEGVVTAVAATVPYPGETPAPGEAPNFDLAAGRCLSACFFAFVGGRRRAWEQTTLQHPVTGSEIGIHRFALEQGTQSVVSAQQLSGMMSSYLSRMGVDPGILAIAASVPDSPPGNMHALTHDEAVRFHVVNLGLPPPSWSLERGSGGDGLVARLKGTAESDIGAYDAWDYDAVLACRAGDGAMTLRVGVSSDTPFPEHGFTSSIAGSFTFALRWERGGVIYRGVAATAEGRDSAVLAQTPNGDMPHPVGAFDLVLESAAVQGGQMKLSFRLGPRSAGLVDRMEQLSFETQAEVHADQGWLPEQISLPWQQRSNISSLLRNNCVGADHG
jgi:hypothetical protein